MCACETSKGAVPNKQKKKRTLMINTNENHPLAQVRLCSDLYDPSIPISQTVKSSSQNSAVDRSIRQIEDWALSHTKRIMVAMDESESAVDAFDWAVDNLVLRGDQGGGESGGSSSSSSRSTGEPAGSKDLVVVAAVIEEREALDLFYGKKKQKYLERYRGSERVLIESY